VTAMPDDRQYPEAEFHHLDPSPRSVAQLYREIGSLKELLATRMDSLEKAQLDFKADMVRVPTEVTKAVAALDYAIGERFKIHDQRFAAQDALSLTRLSGVEAAFTTAKEAVVQALVAQKEAVAERAKSSEAAVLKAEAATTKQIDALGSLIASGQAALDGKIGDLKDRMNRFQGQHQGVGMAWAALVGAIGMIGGAVAVFAALRP
jgi:hypothetical protein